ncbi:M14 family zinc carboxypeptidase [Christiangramia sp. SM2212]|uniref:M14 family zinc carboxypeptidase n=1 Tax=Christiangramia sediminicola TaxID=3073267 RepID=A0ABU1EP16_9FLAO|nr:M14 family zinc carboxypeptidase [Christiangramia sp. SM2212]MDR5590144.1 M14 family zinc carboxypeptidase [Christiangramia sp. SM2212]
MKNEQLKEVFKSDFYTGIKVNEISGRYVANRDLNIVRKKLENIFPSEKIGESVEGRSIYKFQIGNGERKILIWSQMHGNESTTTKAVFDLLNFLSLDDKNSLGLEILNSCTLYIIPILNPDGAKAYTRVNANSIDLNRDLQDLSQPESKLLKKIYYEFKPDFCLNLHDQRTIFSAGDVPKTATLSFLTPSKDEERNIDESRRLSMAVIAKIAEDLDEFLSGHIGRYDDGFNINCAGDTFQNLSTPTILFEAGHSKDDYEREETRMQVFRALISAICQISKSGIDTSDYEKYFKIPENRKLFNDLIIRNASVKGKIRDVSIQFKELRKGEKIEFVPIIEKIAPEISNYGHREIDAEENTIKLPDNSEIIENVIVNKIILNNEELEVKLR